MLLRLYEVHVDKNPPPGLDEKWTDSERYNGAIETFGLGSNKRQKRGSTSGSMSEVSPLGNPNTRTVKGKGGGGYPIF